MREVRLSGCALLRRECRGHCSQHPPCHSERSEESIPLSARFFATLRMTMLRIPTASGHRPPRNPAHLQNFHRHRPQHLAFLCDVLPSSAVSPPNLPHEGRSYGKNVTKLGRNSAEGAGRSPLRFWFLLSYHKRNSPSGSRTAKKKESNLGKSTDRRSTHLSAPKCPIKNYKTTKIPALSGERIMRYKNEHKTTSPRRRRAA